MLLLRIYLYYNLCIYFSGLICLQLFHNSTLHDVSAVDGRSCGSPPSVSNATASPPGPFTVGHTHIYTCHVDYDPLQEPYTTCQENGKWTDVVFQCQRTRPKCTTYLSYATIDLSVQELKSKIIKKQCENEYYEDNKPHKLSRIDKKMQKKYMISYCTYGKGGYGFYQNKV